VVNESASLTSPASYTEAEVDFLLLELEETSRQWFSLVHRYVALLKAAASCNVLPGRETDDSSKDQESGSQVGLAFPTEGEVLLATRRAKPYALRSGDLD
jgi:hypothetical protein